MGAGDSRLRDGDVADVDATDDSGWTALHYAAYWNRVERARLLLRAHADTSIKATSWFWKGMTALHVAEYYSHTAVANLIRQHVAAEKEYAAAAAANAAAARAARAAAAENARRDGGEKAQPDPKRQRCDEKVIKRVLDSRTSDDGEVMYKVSYAGLNKSAEEWLEADVVSEEHIQKFLAKRKLKAKEKKRKRIRDGQGAAAHAAAPARLHGHDVWDACYHGRREKVERHVDADGPIDIRNGVGQTGLMGAVRGGHPDLVGYLVRKGADVNATDNSGETALHWGALIGKEDIVRLLLGANTDVSIKATSGVFKGKTALQVAEEKNHTAVVALLQQHAKPLTADELCAACYDGEIEKVKSHYSLWGDLNLRSGDGGVTGLMGAAQGGARAVVAWLVRVPGIEIDAQNDGGWTALHLAACRGEADCVLVLLEAGADALMKNNRGKTALEVAQQYNKSEVVVAMQEYAAAAGAPAPAAAAAAAAAAARGVAARGVAARGLAGRRPGGGEGAQPVPKRPRPSPSPSPGDTSAASGAKAIIARCPVEARAREYVATLRIADAFLDHDFDRCYCDRCYRPAWPDTISNEGPTPYVVPRGWVRFGLALPPKAAALDIFEKWSVSFHGTKSPLVLKSILECGQLMKPGDALLEPHPPLSRAERAAINKAIPREQQHLKCTGNGCCRLHSAKCAGRQDVVYYTSPTIKYAGLKFYAEPQPFGSRGQSASIALQCRQKPGSFKTQGETMGFEREWPGHLARECPHVDLRTLEWMSANNVAAIPYGLLIRTFGVDDDSYSSPNDDD
eukprot:COSAG02_NODE_1929_length_10336_cov_69.703819_3_plen_795_part_00